MLKLSEYKRVIGSCQILFLAGKSLKRQGVRYTTLAALIGGGIIITNMIGNHLFGYVLPVRNLGALFLPVLTAVLTFGLGNALIGISNLFSSERVLIADANSMNLMEDRKKADMEYHLQVLWDRAFKYEAALHRGDTHQDEAEKIKQHRTQMSERIRTWPDECKKHLGIDQSNLNEFILHLDQFRPLSRQMESTKEGFIISALYAMQNALPQKLQKEWTGFDFSLIEDWYDGAFFTTNDCKLKQQFAAHKDIRAVRKRVGIPLKTRLKETLSGCPDPLWFTLTMKKIGMTIGSLIHRMNKKHVPPTQPAYFDAQDFLWKNSRADELITQHFPKTKDRLREELRSNRKNAMRAIFSPQKEVAHNQIFRMFARDYINALHLRLHYDVEFAAGLLEHNPLRDVQDLENILLCEVFPRSKIEKHIQAASQNVEKLDHFLTVHNTEISRTPLLLRAVRIAFHLNRFRIQKHVTKSPNRALEIIQEHICPSQARYSQRVCSLRQHYELARIQLISYTNMVDDLAEYE